MGSELILVPYNAVQLSDCVEVVWREGFHFFHSRFHAHVEKCDGMFVSRFGVMWRPLQFSLSGSTKIVSACVLLHLFIIYTRSDLSENYFQDIQTVDEAQLSLVAFQSWFRASQELRTQCAQRRRSDLAVRNLRGVLLENLKQ